MITGPQMRRAREALGWSRSQLAAKAKVTVAVVQRAESSPGEPVITITHRNLLLSALRAGGADIALSPSEAVSAEDQT